MRRRAGTWQAGGAHVGHLVGSQLNGNVLHGLAQRGLGAASGGGAAAAQGVGQAAAVGGAVVELALQVLQLQGKVLRQGRLRAPRRASGATAQRRARPRTRMSASVCALAVRARPRTARTAKAACAGSAG